MILGVHGEVVHRRGLGQVFRHRPRHQHAVALQPEVVVQPAGVMLLDDERIALVRNGIRPRAPARGFSTASRMLRYSVSRSRTGARASGRPAPPAGPRRAPPARAPRRSAGGATRGLRVLPRARRRDRRLLAAAQRIRRDGGLRAVVLAPVQEDLAGPEALGHRRRHQRGHRLLQLLRNAFGQHGGALAADRLVERRVQVQALAAAGERDRSSDRCRRSDPGRHAATSQSWAMVTPSPGSRSNTNRVAGPGLSSSALLRVHSATKRHCGTCTSSAACWAIQARPSRLSMIG